MRACITILLPNSANIFTSTCLKFCPFWPTYCKISESRISFFVFQNSIQVFLIVLQLVFPKTFPCLHLYPAQTLIKVLLMLFY